MVVVEFETTLLLRSPHLYRCNRFFRSSCFLPKKEGVNDWLSHKKRVRNFGVVVFHMFSHFLHHLDFSKLVLFDGYLRRIIFAEIPAHHFHHVLGLFGMSIRARNFPDYISRTCICSRSSDNSAEFISLLFCAEKKIF